MFKPIINEQLKAEMVELQLTSACNYAGCGLNHDGWPW